LEFPLHIVELKKAICFVEATCSLRKRSRRLFQWADAPNIQGLDLEKSIETIIQVHKKLGLGSCYGGYFQNIERRWY
jgi:hypothetical protein